MRGFIGILLVANLGVFLVLNFLPGGLFDKGHAPLAEIGNLRLVGENAKKSVKPNTPQATSIQAIEPQAVDRPTRSPELVQAPVPTPAVTQSEPKPEPQAESPSLLATKPPVVPSTAQLASPKPQPVMKTEPVANVVSKPLQQTKPTSKCWRLGRYKTYQEAQNAAGTLPDKLVFKRVGDSVRTQHQGFHVLVPPAKNIHDASKTLKKLRKAGVSDPWLMASGPYQYSVSLGVFNDKNNALNYLRDLQSKGFNIRMRERIDEKIEYWLEVLAPTQEPYKKQLRERFAGNIVLQACE